MNIYERVTKMGRRRILRARHDAADLTARVLIFAFTGSDNGKVLLTGWRIQYADDGCTLPRTLK